MPGIRAWHVKTPRPGPGELLLRVLACGVCSAHLAARVALARGRFDGAAVLIP